MRNKTPHASDIAKQIRKERTNREWTRSKLANEVGCDRSTIKRIEDAAESGDTKYYPDLKSLIGIANAFQMDLFTLLYGKTKRDTEGMERLLDVHISMDYKYVCKYFSLNEKHILHFITKLLITSNRRKRESLEYELDLDSIVDELWSDGNFRN